MTTSAKRLGPLRLWFRFGSLKQTLEANRGALFEVEFTGDSKFALGRVALLKDSRFDSRQLAEGPAAWRAIADDPEAINAVLTCRKCGFRHVIREQPRGIQRLIAISSFGRFHDQYQGMWQSTWFRLVAPVIERAMGIKSVLICQSCKVEESPLVRLC